MFPSDQPLVPTQPRPSNHHATGTYDSSDRLPTTGLLFERLLARIRSAHENRNLNPVPFRALWKKALSRLKSKGNATAYANWKINNLVKNIKDFKDLDDEIADAWAGVQLSRADEDDIHYRRVAYSKLRHLQLRRDQLKPDTTFKIDDTLEIAIAFWIEARNAYNSSDEARAMHALLECNFYLGAAYSPTTAAELQRSNGIKSFDPGPKNAIVAAAVDAIGNYQATGTLHHPDELCGRIAQTVEFEPKYSDVVAEYRNWKSDGVAADVEVGDRIYNLLSSLTEKKNGSTEYPEFRKAFEGLFKRVCVK